MIPQPTESIPQRTEAWFEARLGKLGASKVKDAIDFLKNGKPSQKRQDLLLTIVAERLTGQVADNFTTKEMQWGTDTEPFARAAYEDRTGNKVDETGWRLHPTLEGTGASPDGLIGADGLLEIKCPRTTTHLRWMQAGEVPEDHQAQMLWQMACTGRSWCDFVSYDPRIPGNAAFFCIRFHRDEKKIQELEQLVAQFLNEVDEAMGVFSDAF